MSVRLTRPLAVTRTRFFSAEMLYLTGTAFPFVVRKLLDALKGPTFRRLPMRYPKRIRACNNIGPEAVRRSRAQRTNYKSSRAGVATARNGTAVVRVLLAGPRIQTFCQ